MALILNIDSSTDFAAVALARDGDLVGMAENGAQKDHAAWLHPAIESMMGDQRLTMNELNAVALCAGPGSYTGLRVAMAAAKGFCYALGLPLITENTLTVMAYGMRELLGRREDLLYCPMIDARRMEVFAAVYTAALSEQIPPAAFVLNKNLFENLFSSHTIAFAGTGSLKWKSLGEGSKSIFIDKIVNIKYLAQISYQKFRSGTFTDLIYSEPIYLKDFHNQTLK